jgi:hypothetical protein
MSINRYDTPSPIKVTLEFDVAVVRINATTRTDTVVTLTPTSQGSSKDNRAAEDTTTSFNETTRELVVRGPKRLAILGPGRNSGSITLDIELPAGSAVHASGPMADYTCTGPLGDTRLSTSMGRISLAEATTARLKTSYGDVRLDHATGDVDVNGCGRIELGDLDASATVKNSNGDISIDQVTGPVRATTANGEITIEQAGADVDASSAHGRIRLGEVTQGNVKLRTAAGDLAIGIAPDTAAWLDLNTTFGSVRNAMAETAGSGDARNTAQVRARTSYGDITVTRSRKDAAK